MGQPEPAHKAANALAVFSLVLLASEDRFLLLQRAVSKRFAPGLWTGIGGQVEPGELDDLATAAMRELTEETGIPVTGVSGFRLRRALLHARPGAPLTVLLYFTGRLAQPVELTSPEGTLRWLTTAEIGALDLIDNAALVLPLLIDDLSRAVDDGQDEPVRVGAAHYRPDGALERIVWA